MSRRGLASLAASLAAHGAGLALVVLLVGSESLPALLFVDLMREPGPGTAAAPCCCMSWRTWRGASINRI